MRQEDTWTEVARRALELFATALRVRAADASGGLDNWVGMPRHSESHPLNCLDFPTVLQARMHHERHRMSMLSYPAACLVQVPCSILATAVLTSTTRATVRSRADVVL